ncbi:MAG: hypothetical protein LC723_05435, partial [Actinobacteria bacterium]|nr:hypothetical protein [Actinomycetota bacterium]
QVGGINVREARIPTWIALVLLAIPLWAMLYLMAGGGADIARTSTGCEAHPDHTFTCFLPK